MIGIPGVGNPLSVLNLSKSIINKMDNLISKKDTSDVNALSIKESIAPKDRVDRIEKIGDDQAGRFERFERIFAAHTRAHAVDKMVSHLMSKKDTNGDGVLNVGEFGVPEDIFDKIDKNSDGQVGKAELNIAAHAHIHAMSERTNHLISKKDTNGDGQAGRVDLNVAARTHAALNNMISEILPHEASSSLDAIV